MKHILTWRIGSVKSNTSAEESFTKEDTATIENKKEIKSSAQGSSGHIEIWTKDGSINGTP